MEFFLYLLEIQYGVLARRQQVELEVFAGVPIYYGCWAGNFSATVSNTRVAICRDAGSTNAQKALSGFHGLQTKSRRLDSLRRRSGAGFSNATRKDWNMIDASSCITSKAMRQCMPRATSINSTTKIKALVLRVAFSFEPRIRKRFSRMRFTPVVVTLKNLYFSKLHLSGRTRIAVANRVFVI